MNSLNKAIKLCDSDKDNPMKGQIDIFGNTSKGKTRKEYKVSFVLKGNNYRSFKYVDAYSAEQAKGYVIDQMHKMGKHKLFDIQVEEI